MSLSASRTTLSWLITERKGIPTPTPLVKVEGDSLTKIFAVLRNQSHVDFSHYKLTTIKRRIARRMVIHKTKKLEEYFCYLQSHPQEVRALFADILINVTEFFRDPDVYTALKKQVLSKIVKDRTAGSRSGSGWSVARPEKRLTQ